MASIPKSWSFPLTWGSSISGGFVFAWWKFYRQTQIRQADVSCGERSKGLRIITHTHTHKSCLSGLGALAGLLKIFSKAPFCDCSNPELELCLCLPLLMSKPAESQWSRM